MWVTPLNNNTHFKKSLTTNLLKKIGATIGITVLIFIVLLFYSYQIYHQYIWYEHDLIYHLGNFVKNNIITIAIVLISIDTIIIFWLRYRESLQYIEKMLDAGKALVADNDILIVLPEELKEIEDQMNQIKRESIKNKNIIKQSEQQKNDLLLYLAHDLKTPLTSVVGYLDLLLNQPNLTVEERSNYTDIAYDKAIRLEELINEFFDIAKYNLSDINLKLENVNISVMLSQISYEFMPLYKQKNIECITNIEDDLNINIDINQFERVFDNLIRNAINYSSSDSILNINAGKTKNDIIIEFSNQVSNISSDKLESIFEPFIRLDQARNSKTGGSGLGLAITKKIIELHNGTIDVNINNGVIKFTIKLPL